MDRASDNNDLWPTTHWSLVGQAGSGNDAERRQALTELIARYLPVLRRHLLLFRRVSRDQVDDLLQEFLLSKILEQAILERADQNRGKFRSFLATALDRFVLNRQRDERALKRSPNRAGALDDAAEPVDVGVRPEAVFDIAWARQVLGQAVRRMRRDCRERNRADIWGVFRARILDPCLLHAKPVPYADLVRRFGFASPVHASNILVSANRMFERSLRRTISAYEREKSQIDQELMDLWDALARPRR